MGYGKSFIPYPLSHIPSPLGGFLIGHSAHIASNFFGFIPNRHERIFRRGGILLRKNAPVAPRNADSRGQHAGEVCQEIN